MLEVVYSQMGSRSLLPYLCHVGIGSGWIKQTLNSCKSSLETKISLLLVEITHRPHVQTYRPHGYTCTTFWVTQVECNLCYHCQQLLPKNTLTGHRTLVKAPVKQIHSNAATMYYFSELGQLQSTSHICTPAKTSLLCNEKIIHTWKHILKRGYYYKRVCTPKWSNKRILIMLYNYNIGLRLLISLLVWS